MISGISWILKFRITQRSNVSVMTGYQCLNRLCVRKFSRVFLFPSFVSNNRFLWTRQFSFAHFTRQRLFVIFSYEISPELIPSRMPDVQPLFLFAWGSWQSHVEIKSTSLGQNITSSWFRRLSVSSFIHQTNFLNSNSRWGFFVMPRGMFYLLTLCWEEW